MVSVGVMLPGMVSDVLGWFEVSLVCFQTVSGGLDASVGASGQLCLGGIGWAWGGLIGLQVGLGWF